MNGATDDPRDELLSARLTAALGEVPPALVTRLERLTTIGLDARPPAPTRHIVWLRVVPQVAGIALGLAFIACLTQAPGPSGALASPSPVAWEALAVPIGILIGMEATRGAPTVRRLLG